MGAYVATHRPHTAVATSDSPLDLFRQKKVFASKIV